MSDLPDLPDPPSELPRPLPPRTWRDRIDDLAAGGHSPGRLLAAACAVTIAAVVGWRLLAPPAPPPEMELPFAEQSARPDEPAAPGAAPPAAAGEAPAGASAAESGAALPSTAGAPAGGGAGGEVVVHVVGAVEAPGVQRLPVGARVIDAIDAAGGASPDADLGRINLAAVLADGQQVYVLRPGETPPLPPPGAGAAGLGGSGGSGAPGGTGGLVDINTASAAQLEELPGVGPTTAAAIISHRDQHGPFASVDDLLDVRGIGEAKLEQLRDLATV
jgi:competence protein ComEA